MERRLAWTPRRDDGFTLVELLIYILLAVVVFSIVAGMFINSLRVENTVRTSAEAATGMQLASQSLGRGVRNASAIEVTAPAADTILIRTRSLDSTATGSWLCQAWYIGAGAIRTTTSTAAIGTPDAATAETWTLLVEGVAPVDPSVPIALLAADERSLSVDFTVDNGEGVPLLLSTTLVSLQPIPSTGKVTAPCF